MLKNIFLVTNIIIQTPALSADDSAIHQSEAKSDLIRLQDILTGTVKGTGIVALCPESVRVLLEEQLHKSDPTVNRMDNVRYTASLDATHIKTMINDANSITKFAQFNHYTFDFGHIDFNEHMHTIYRISGTGTPNSPTAKGSFSIIVDKQGKTAVKRIIESPTPSPLETPKSDIEQKSPTLTRQTESPLPARTEPEERAPSPSSNPSSPTSSIKLEKNVGTSPLSRVGRFFRKQSSSSNKSQSSPSEASSSSPTPSRKGSTSSSSQQALNQQLAKELERRNSRN